MIFDREYEGETEKRPFWARNRLVGNMLHDKLLYSYGHEGKP